tara:strand:- start:94 stop:213 length:120 start_codon:yes stop_codon:yes gene_type:complete
MKKLIDWVKMYYILWKEERKYKKKIKELKKRDPFNYTNF